MTFEPQPAGPTFVLCMNLRVNGTCTTYSLKYNKYCKNTANSTDKVLSRPGQKSLGDKIRVTLRGEEITKNTSVKYLGVTVDQDLKWNLHVAKFQQKCWACLGTIRRAYSYLPTATRKMSACATSIGLNM